MKRKNSITKILISAEFVIIFLFVLAFFYPSKVLSQSNSNEDLTREKLELDNEKSKLDIESKKAEIRSNNLNQIRENLVDPGKIKNPEIELNGDFAIEGYTLASEALGEVVFNLYNTIKSSESLKNIKYLIIASKDDISIQSLKYHNEFNFQIKLFKEAYRLILLDAEQPEIEALSLTSVASVASIGLRKDSGAISRDKRRHCIKFW